MQAAAPQQVSEDIKNLIQSFLITPKQSKAFLLREMGIAFIQNLFAITAYLYLNIKLSWDQYTCNFLLGMWFTIFGLINMVSLICKALFLPQLAIMKYPPKEDYFLKRKFIKDLKILLSTSIYKKNTYLSQYLIIMYIIGTIIVVLSYLKSIFFPAECFEDNPIRLFAAILIQTFYVKFYFTIQSNNRLEQEISKESQNAFLMKINYEQIDREKQSTCSICLVDFDEIQPISEFQCLGLHLFHEDCIKKWLNDKSGILKKCPYCIQVPPEYQ